MLTSSLVLLVAGASGVLGSTLDRRAPDTNATCSPDFNWMDNTASVSPCRLAAVVSSACHGSTWNVPALTSSKTTYSAPNASLGTIETCSCSWIAYNLFAACEFCQGYPGSVTNWATWSFECGDKIPPTAFPEVPLADGTLIPYYATNDPNNWTDQRFNAAQAQTIVSSGHTDVSQKTATAKKKSTPVGAIVGGVIGGLAAIAIAVGIAFWIHKAGKKKGSNKPRFAPSVTSDGMTTLTFGSAPGHLRQLSDTSAKSIGLGYQNLAGSFVTSSATNTRGPMSPVSMHTHTGSVNSLSYFGSVQNSVAPYANSTSPPPPSVPPLPAAHVAPGERENIITPFTLTPAQQQQRATSPNNYPADRKRADGAIIPVYDSPDSLPSDLGRGGSRGRMNPPAYSASVNHDQPLDSISQGAPSRPAHTKKGSADTVTTLASPISPDSPISPVTYGTGVNTHISGIDDIIGQLNLQPPAPTVSGTGATQGTGQSIGINRNQPYRPNNGAEEPEI